MKNGRKHPFQPNEKISMRSALVVLFSLLLVVGSSKAAQPRKDIQENLSGGGAETTRQCGWFAILGCFTDRQSAFRLNDELETGVTLETNKSDFPGLNSDRFCVVKGPVSQQEARELVKTFNGQSVQKACRNLPE